MNVKPMKTKEFKKQANESTTCVSGSLPSKSALIHKIKLYMNDYVRTKYATSTYFYYTRDIDAIAFQKRTSSTIKYKQVMDSDCKYEVLKRFYKRAEINKKILQLCEYFKFHYEIPRIFLDGFISIIDVFHDRRRNIIYQRVKEEIGKENIVGDESNSQQHDKREQRVNYTSILKSLKHSQRYHMSKGDSLHDLLSQMEAVRMSHIKGDLSIVTNDGFQRNALDFNRFLMSINKGVEMSPADFKPPGNSQLSLKQAKESPLNPKPSNMKRKSKVTVITDNGNSVQDVSGLKSIINRVLTGIKGSPVVTIKKENIFKKKKSTAEVDIPRPLEKYLGKSEIKNGMELLNKHNLFSRNNSLFNSMKERKSTSIGKPVSTRNNLSPDFFTRTNFMNIKTEPDVLELQLPKHHPGVKKSAKKSTQLSGKIKPKVSQHLAAIKSLDEKKKSKLQTQATEESEIDTMRNNFNTKPQILANRSSFSNIIRGSMTQKIVLLKRLKSEGKEEHQLKQSDFKPTDLFTIKQKIKPKQVGDSTVKKTKKKTTNKEPVQGSSFRTRTKITSMNIS